MHNNSRLPPCYDEFIRLSCDFDLARLNEIHKIVNFCQKRPSLLEGVWKACSKQCVDSLRKGDYFSIFQNQKIGGIIQKQMFVRPLFRRYSRIAELLASVRFLKFLSLSRCDSIIFNVK